MRPRFPAPAGRVVSRNNSQKLDELLNCQPSRSRAMFPWRLPCDRERSSVCVVDLADAKSYGCLAVCRKHTQPSPGPSRLRGPKQLARHSRRNLYNLFGYRWRDRFTVCLQALQIPSDCFFNIFKHFAAGFSLGNTAWKRRDFRNVNAVFILLDQDAKSHSSFLPELNFTGFLKSGTFRMPPALVICDSSQFLRR